MKALILAAGKGSRLYPITKEIPKALVEINNIPIIFNQINCLYDCGINDITIVVGYKGDILSKRILDVFPNINIINNSNFDKTNNMYSAYLAKDYFNDDFIMMNSDVFFDMSVIKALVHDKQKNLIVTDINNYLDESMKIKVNDNKVTEISKLINKEEAYGTSIDVYKFSKKAGQFFFDKCTDYINKNELCLWSEVALNDILKEVEFIPCKIDGRWYEIDNVDDLNNAQRIFSIKD